MLAFPDCFWFRLPHRGWFFPFSFLMLLMEGFFTMFCMAFLPYVQLQFFEFIYGIPRLHIWNYPSRLRQNTINSDFFPTCFSLWHSLFLYYSSTLTAFGMLDLNSASELFASNISTFFLFKIHKKFLTSTHCFEHWKWESGCLLRKILLPFSSLFKV